MTCWDLQVTVKHAVFHPIIQVGPKHIDDHAYGSLTQYSMTFCSHGKHKQIYRTSHCYFTDNIGDTYSLVYLSIEMK